MVELAGDAAAVECERAEVEHRHGPANWASDRIDEVDLSIEWLRALQGGSTGPATARTRMSVFTAELAPTLSALSTPQEPPPVLVYPGLGLVYRSEGPSEPTSDEVSSGTRHSLDAILAKCELAANGGEWVHEILPRWCKEGRDVFRVPTDSLPIMRALKERFDPNAILNPGRFVGRL